jgi:hypothetical protein
VVVVEGVEGKGVGGSGSGRGGGGGGWRERGWGVVVEVDPQHMLCRVVVVVEVAAGRCGVEMVSGVLPGRGGR